MEINNIIFDFDGVILDSHKIKTDAFKIIFKEYGNNISIKAKEFHLKNIGKNRMYKFKYILKNILKKKHFKKDIIKLNKNFSSYCDKKIDKIEPPISLINFLKKNYKRKNFFISTGTPENVIKKIIKKKKLSKYFKKVYGSPKTKIEHIKKIIKDQNNKNKTIFIGDSKIDYLSSKKAGIKFLLKINSESINLKFNTKVSKIYNFKNFEKNFN